MSRRIRNHRRKYVNKGLRKVKNLIKDKDKVLGFSKSNYCWGKSGSTGGVEWNKVGTIFHLINPKQ